MEIKQWIGLSIALSFFGFLKETRPSDNFLFEYLTEGWWHYNSEQVLQELLPILTYAQFGLSLIVFLITDLFRYKPIIILLAASGIITWSLLLWGRTLLQVQISMVFVGMFWAAEVAYFTYIYAKVPKEHYVQVTSHTRAALIFGHGISGVLSQALIQFKLLDYRQLNYITFGSMVIALMWAFMLPSVDTSVYFHSQGDDTTNKWTKAFKLMKDHFIASYSQWYVIKWSLWWSLSMCGFIHVQLYIQPLWSSIAAETNGQLYNGFAETAMTVVGFITTILAGILKINWRKYADIVIVSSSTLTAVFIIISSQAGNVLISCAAYTAYGGIYYFVVTIAASEVAKCILEDSYGLVFGLNASITLLAQCLLLLVFVTGDLGWALKPRQQHLAYGLCHAGLAILFILMAIVRLIKYRRNPAKNEIV